MRVSRWLRCAPAGAARARLVAASRAGGSARDFDAWPALLGDDIELCAVQPPGRLERFREPARRDLLEIATEVAAAVAGLEPLPYVLFGDCMGALVAYETASALREAGAALPSALVVGSYPAPDVPRSERAYAHAPATELRDRLREVGGVAGEVLEDDEFFELLLPTLRADFAAFEGYRHAPRPAFELDVHVLVGRDDRYVPAGQVRGWARHTTGRFAVHAFDGDHFFLRSNREAVRFVGDLTRRASRAA